MPDPKADLKDSEILARRLSELEYEVQRLKVSYANKGRYITQASEPTCATHEYLFWEDSDNGNIYLVFRADGSTQVKVQLS